MTSFLTRRPVTSFVVLAYLGSWIGWGPWWLSQSGIGLLPYTLDFGMVAGINQLGLFAGPFAAALLMTRLTGGRAGVRRFWAGLVQWRVRPMAYVIALGAIPVAAGLGYFLTLDTGSLNVDPGTLATAAALYLVFILGGPLQEEPGWRGFAMPRMQVRMHPLVAAVALGVIHCFWHLPLFLTDQWDTPRGDVGQLIAYLIMVVSLSVVMAWAVNTAVGSVLIAILAHNGVNWAPQLAMMLTGSTITSMWPAAIGLLILAAGSVALTRGRLGYVAAPPAAARPTMAT